MFFSMNNRGKRAVQAKSGFAFPLSGGLAEAAEGFKAVIRFNTSKFFITYVDRESGGYVLPQFAFSWV